MAWERRERGGLYYTRSRRVRGRVVREYFGCGEVARAIAVLDELDREERCTQRAERELELLGPMAALRAVDALEGTVDSIVEAALTAAGYHRHRGQWRKRRRNEADTNHQDATGDPARGRPNAPGGGER